MRDSALSCLFIRGGEAQYLDIEFKTLSIVSKTLSMAWAREREVDSEVGNEVGNFASLVDNASLLYVIALCVLAGYVSMRKPHRCKDCGRRIRRRYTRCWTCNRKAG